MFAAMKKIISILSVFFLMFSIQAQTINSKMSYVSFEISNMGVRTVDGTIGGMKGVVNYEPQNLKASEFNVCIQANTINTENEDRDVYLKNADFFDVEKYPEICFVSSSFVQNGSELKVHGTLSMHGISKKVSIPFSVKDKLFKGTFTVERKDYKIGEDFGNFMVGSEVEITIVCQLN